MMSFAPIRVALDARCAAAYLLVLCAFYFSATLPSSAPIRTGELGQPSELRGRAVDGNATRGGAGGRAPDGHPRPLNVTLTHHASRGDRLGSALQLPLGAWLVARYHGWAYCSPPHAFARALSFPMCDGDNLTPRERDTLLRSTEGRIHNYVNDAGVTESGVWHINRDTKTLWKTVQGKAMCTPGVVSDWRQMILGAKVRPELATALWQRKDSVRIAVHVRRGDIGPNRNDVWVADDKVLALLAIAKHYVRQKRGPDTDVEVHVFSEDYGITNWTRYDDAVLHLAPNTGQDATRTDLDLCLRDWQHFVTADVLLVGGTFSAVPAVARPDPGPDGLPLTLFYSWGLHCRAAFVHWTGRNRDVVAVQFPGGPIAARVGADGAPPSAPFELR